MELYDVIIIGGGPIGLACALEAKKKKLNYLVIEKGTVANSLYNYPLYMTFFSTADRLEIDEIPFITAKPKPGRQDALEYYQGIARQKEINIRLYEKVLRINKADAFTVTTNKNNYNAKNIIIATGFYDIPNLMNVPGEELAKVRHYYTEPYPYAFQNVVVIGSSNSSVDAALEIYRKGGNVTMIIRNKDISTNVKYWVRPDIENRINEGSIQAYFESELLEVKPNRVIFRTNDDEIHDIQNDFVLALTGYLPDFEFLKSAGIQLNGECENPSYNPQTMETNVEGIYLAGVVCGGRDTHLWFIENSRIHAKQIVSDIVEKRD